MMAGMILIDLQKAFDTIDHDMLLQKLYVIGFSKRTVNWFKSYLSNRYFKVNLGHNFSQPASVSCGVLQGSILGPLLFLIYVNDMSHEIEKHLNVDFSNIWDWFVDNKLSIHFREDKTKSIIFASKFKNQNIKNLLS